MATQPLLLIVYAPALVRDDSRRDTLVHAMEHALPGLRLSWTISDEGQFVPVPQRDRPDGELSLLCNGDEDHLVTLTGWESPAGTSPGGEAQLEVHAKWPMDAAGISNAMEVLSAVAEEARAFWGHSTPDGAALDIALQTSPSLDGPPRPPRGLPALKLPEDLGSPKTPHRLGWLNYWSAATARALGFPDPARDAELLTRSRRTATGGWVVQLTDTPLDLDDPRHLDALLRAYERFPAIGGRSAP